MSRRLTNSISCPHCSGLSVIRRGSYLIRHCGRRIKRLYCQGCRRTFSRRTNTPTYRQRKPYLNHLILKLLCSGSSFQRISRVLGISPDTVYRKLIWLDRHLPYPEIKGSPETLYFDEMETIEHTKLKPLSILIVTNNNYEILELKACEMPAKGRLAATSVRKYGKRKDERGKLLKEILEKFQDLNPKILISDDKPLYRTLVRQIFPEATHQRFNRAQKEKHRERLHEKTNKAWDPMFVLNQRCAMLRYDIRRLTRRSWCTTKKLERLQMHLNLYLRTNNGLTWPRHTQLLN